MKHLPLIIAGIVVMALLTGCSQQGGTLPNGIDKTSPNSDAALQEKTLNQIDQSLVSETDEVEIGQMV